MKIGEKVAALSSSAHTGRALKAAKFLNLVGTVRGAVTTVLLASSAIGGAVTVNNVRQDIAKDQSTATANPARVASARTTPPPTPTPLTAAGLRADAQKRLQAGLDQVAQGADDLRKVSILTASATDALVAQTRQRLQARFDQAMTQVDELIAPATPAPVASAPSSPNLSVIAVNSLVQVALTDMGGILIVATRQATEPPATVTQRPTVAPAPTKTSTPAPTQPARTPSPTVRASPTR
jgi:hypothetical protein